MRVRLAERMGLPATEDGVEEAQRVFEVLAALPHSAEDPIPTRRAPAIKPATAPKQQPRSGEEMSETERAVQRTWLTLDATGCTEAEGGCPVDEDLMLLGATSVKMGTLASRVGAHFGIALSPAVIFAPPRSIRAIAAEVDALRDAKAARDADETDSGSPTSSMADCTTVHGVVREAPPPLAESEFAPIAMALQALPTLILPALTRLSSFGLFMLLFVTLHKDIRYLEYFIFCLFASHAITLELAFPIFGVAFKWLIIGRYRAGCYPLWGSYYLRWWLVDKTLRHCGRGALFNSSDVWRCRYLRLLGATVGTGVRIAATAHITEADLVSIGDDAAIDTAIISPFAADAGAMLLRPVVLGHRSGVCRSCTLGPGAKVSAGVCLGPLTSSHTPPLTLEQSAENRKLCRPDFCSPPLWLQCALGLPCQLFVTAAAMLPNLLCLLLYSIGPSDYRHAVSAAAPWLTKWDDFALWLSDYWRVTVLILILFTRATITPFVRLAATILVKRLVIGRFRPGPKGVDEYTALRAPHTHRAHTRRFHRLRRGLGALPVLANVPAGWQRPLRHSRASRSTLGRRVGRDAAPRRSLWRAHLLAGRHAERRRIRPAHGTLQPPSNHVC